MSMAILSGTHQKPKAGFIVCNSAIKMYTDTSFAKDMITCKSVSWYMSVKNNAVIMYKKALCRPCLGTVLVYAGFGETGTKAAG